MILIDSWIYVNNYILGMSKLQIQLNIKNSLTRPFNKNFKPNKEGGKRAD